MPASASFEDMRQLISMSLGEAVSGEVNFKYLHTLLHEILNKLEAKEESAPPVMPAETEAVEEGEDQKDATEKSVSPTAQKERTVVGVMRDADELHHRLREMEARVETIKSLDDILDKANESSTPIQDLMDYLSLQSRIGGLESGLKGNAGLLDQLLREFKDLRESYDSLKTQSTEANQQTEQNFKDLEGKLSSLTGMQSGMGDASITALVQVKEKVEALESSVSGVGEKVNQVEGNLKEGMGGLEKEKASRSDLEQYITWDQMDQAFKEHRGSPPTPIPADHPSPEVVEALRVVGELADEYESLKDRLRNMEDDLDKKITAEDVASLVPDDSEQLMSTLLEMQTKLGDLDSDLSNLLPKIPEDLEGKIAELEGMLADSKLKLEALEGLPAVQEDWESQLQEVASQLAQAKERLTEVDKAIVDVATAVTEIQDKPEEDKGSALNEEKLGEITQRLDNLHDQQHEMMESNQNVNEEIAINKEFIKKLYGESEQLKESKADKTVLSLMDEKADRKQLENKASKQWVDSTFSQLDEEIRNARAKMQEQEDALRLAMEQMGGEVEQKLDKEEIEPLKNYLDEKLKNLPQQQAAENMADIADSAAGMRKPVRRFKCISCDRPVQAQLQEAYPSLPQAATLPSRQSFRPYTTYELDLIRQHQRLNQGQGVYDVLDILPSLRPCGGAHTVMSTQKRLRAGPGGAEVQSPDTSEPYTVMYSGPSLKDELDLVGYDGHVYKGRNSGKLPALKKSRSGRIPARPSTSPTSSRGSPTPAQYVQSLKV